MTASWEGLTDALSTAPNFQGAACVGQWNLFDPPDSDVHEHPRLVRERHDEAKALCAACPVFGRCSSWAKSLSPGEVSGVLAGTTYRPPTRSLPPYKRRAVA
ncbi:WhiB family transcriptional regulator [Rhodococcus sp. 14-2470-1a]|uniref:WhiB family transcriptional regulator n=1 Tax=Rhodococcus sp. 14-2470-1a TaxID=2023150 RepID=UPI000B9A5C29|nr:WhiB family transcriptional regulator [Rhodococcus sp. 14-2470-1a]OZF57019.1 hypothetical protein CH292_02005 [Rhodococcus sp. 14-2470-1a]